VTSPLKVIVLGRKLGLATTADRTMMKSLGSVLKLVHCYATVRLVMGNQLGNWAAEAVFWPAEKKTAKLLLANTEPLPSIAKLLAPPESVRGPALSVALIP
jgi:hypothetical protein